MSAPPEFVDGLVLARDLAGEGHLRLTLLTPTDGLQPLFLRVRQRRAAAQPDLFDDLHAEVEGARHGGGRFLREWEVRRRPDGLARQPAAFLAACAVAAEVLAHRGHAESFDTLHRLLGDALAAWAAGAPVEVVRFKLYYCWARDEGYPVKEQWWTALAPEARATVAELLRAPARDLAPLNDPARPLATHLRAWLARETQLTG